MKNWSIATKLGVAFGVLARNSYRHGVAEY